jgi:hypothetical protein
MRKCRSSQICEGERTCSHDIGHVIVMTPTHSPALFRDPFLRSRQEFSVFHGDPWFALEKK